MERTIFRKFIGSYLKHLSLILTITFKQYNIIIPNDHVKI